MVRRSGSSVATRSIFRWTANRSPRSSAKDWARNRSSCEGKAGMAMTACSSTTKSLPDAAISRGAGKIEEPSAASAPRHTPRITVAINNNCPNRDLCTIPPYEALFLLYGSETLRLPSRRRLRRTGRARGQHRRLDVIRRDLPGQSLQPRHDGGHLGIAQLFAQLVLGHVADGLLQLLDLPVVEVRPGHLDIPQR